MPNLNVLADVDTFMGSANKSEMGTNQMTVLSPAYASPYTFDAAAKGLLVEVRMTVTGALTINKPTNGVDGMLVNYFLLASGASRTITLGADLIVPTGLTFDGVVASGSTRFLQLCKSGTKWMLTQNLEFIL